jgi:prepilin-type N-terminal cleavage/methylation domain-containing protein
MQQQKGSALPDTQQAGFTMIELIMVIVILGILAAVALPRFYDLQTDARVAKMQAALGAIKSASAIGHSGRAGQQQTAATGERSAWKARTRFPWCYGYPDVGATPRSGIVIAAGGSDRLHHVGHGHNVDHPGRCHACQLQDYLYRTTAAGTADLQRRADRSRLQ